MEKQNFGMDTGFVCGCGGGGSGRCHGLLEKSVDTCGHQQDPDRGRGNIYSVECQQLPHQLPWEWDQAHQETESGGFTSWAPGCSFSKK